MSFPSFYFSFLPRGEIDRCCRKEMPNHFFFRDNGVGGWRGQVVAAALLFSLPRSPILEQRSSNLQAYFKLSPVSNEKSDHFNHLCIFPFFCMWQMSSGKSPMGLTAERGEKRRGRWKEREIFLTSGWEEEEEEEDGNGTFGGKKKTERWAAKGRTRDTDKEEEERLSFFFLSFWMLEGIRLFSQGQNVAENTSEKRGLFKGNLKWALGFIARFVFFFSICPFSYYLSPPPSSSSIISLPLLSFHIIVMPDWPWEWRRRKRDIVFLRRRAKDWHIFGFQKNGEKRKIYWLLCENVLVWGKKKAFFTLNRYIVKW